MEWTVLISQTKDQDIHPLMISERLLSLNDKLPILNTFLRDVFEEISIFGFWFISKRLLFGPLKMLILKYGCNPLKNIAPRPSNGRTNIDNILCRYRCHRKCLNLLIFFSVAKPWSLSYRRRLKEIVPNKKTAFSNIRKFLLVA